MGTASTALDRPRSATAGHSSGDVAPQRWWQSTFAAASAGSVLLWAALPPLTLSLLAWLAPIPWILLVRRNQLTGRRPYFMIWLSSFLMYLASFYWLTLPHWATSFGWLALAAYLAFYLPMFVGLTRVAVHRLGISTVVAAPVVWTGLEFARAHLLSGITMASLATTQYRWPLVLQIADIFGSYGVSFLLVLVAACIARLLPSEGRPRAWWPAAVAIAAIAATLAYGQWRIGETPTEPGPKVALIQGSIDIDMKHDPTQSQRIFDEYFDLSRRATRENSDLDLMVWPETMFRYPWFIFEEGYQPAPDTLTAEEAIGRSHRAIANTVEPLGVPLLLGIDTVYGTAAKREPIRYNSALFVDAHGRELARYDKCHPVMFGEYVPFAETFPWLYALTPLAGGLASGDEPIAAQDRQRALCSEHLLRGHAAAPDPPAGARAARARRRTRRAGQPDQRRLVLGLQRARHAPGLRLLRAVECRKPLLIAANTGFSAWIDSAGRIRAEGPRRTSDVLVANVEIDRRTSWYLDHGDLPAGLCLAASGGLGLVGLGGWWRRRKAHAAA